jgi:ankyrin repeat protein
MASARTLEEVLQSTSDVLFPEESGGAPVSIDSADCDGDTPLHVLIWRGDTEGALLLIRHGADVNAVGDMGETPLHVAISMRNTSVIGALLGVGASTEMVSEFGKSASEQAEEIGIDLDACK